MVEPNEPVVVSKSGTSRLQKVGLHVLFFLRFIQLGLVTITGFIYCYLAWHHNNHFCAFYPRSCTELQRSYVHVPWEYKVVIAACTLAFLESYASTIYFVHRQQLPNYRILLITITPVVVLFGVACGSIFHNPSLSGFCWFLQVPQSIAANVEERNCVIVVNGYVSLSIAVGFTGFIFLLSAGTAGVVTYQRMARKRIMLPTRTDTEGAEHAGIGAAQPPDGV